jgi:hypothetical protein
MCQTAFSVMPSPRVLPIFVTRRKILPLSIPDACSQAPSSSITHAGMGTVRTWPALPVRSTIAQCSYRCSRCSILSPTASCRLSPQARSSARSARSRGPFSFSQSGACHSARLCSAVSRLPRRTQISYSFHASNAGGEIGTQKTGVRRLIGKTPYGAETEVDRTGRKRACFEVTAITKNHRTVQCQPRLRAVPVNEFVDRVAISSLPSRLVRLFRTAVLENSRLGRRKWALGFLAFVGNAASVSWPVASVPQSHNALFVFRVTSGWTVFPPGASVSVSTGRLSVPNPSNPERW